MIFLDTGDKIIQLKEASVCADEFCELTDSDLQDVHGGAAILIPFKAKIASRFVRHWLKPATAHAPGVN
jgi:hypothetical protein